MIQATRTQIAAIEAAAEAAYPGECCGLLIGRGPTGGDPAGGDLAGGDIEVTRVIAAANLLAGAADDRFEIDPQTRFDVMRALRVSEQDKTDPERIVGHYHSHPDHAAEPSAHDAKKVLETDLVWLITAVAAGKAAETRAFRPRYEGGGFVPEDLAVG